MAVTLPPIPPRIAVLPRDDRGYPVPWFVAWVDGKPEFRCADGEKFRRAIQDQRCWVCGEPLGKWLVFVIGPMCAVNRTTAEPPCHLECAQFSVQACPFLAKPKAQRRESGLPDETSEPAGFAIRRNPGVSLLWVCRTYSLFAVDNGVLFKLAEPTRTEWWAEGRLATREEIMESIETGLPLLRSVAAEDGPEALRELALATDKAMHLVPRQQLVVAGKTG